MHLLNNPWVIGIGVAIFAFILDWFFGVSKLIKNKQQDGGRGGSARIIGANSTAIGGKGGAAGPGGAGGYGGNAKVSGDNSFAMGGEGGEAGQADRAGKGGRAPLHALLEDYPEKYKEIVARTGITEEEAKTIGKGGNGA